MRAANILKNRFFSESPFFLILYVTARCNARCKFCYYWDNISNWRTRQHLEVDEIEKIASRLDTLQQLTISGGEPFLREELAEICTIFRKNCDAFLKKDGYGLLVIKARSIDVTKRPKQIFMAIRQELEEFMTVIDYRILDPYQKDHCMILVKKE